MFTESEIKKIKEYSALAEEKIKNVHINCFKGHTKPVLLISKTYPGIWLEHVYDSVLLCEMYPEYLFVAKNTVELFIENQKPNGQLPCYVWDGNKINVPPEQLVGYGQVQECLSFAELTLEICKKIGDTEFTAKCYDALKKWENWFTKYRMTENTGLAEMFVGYDTGHDNSGRLNGMLYKGNRVQEGINAETPPKKEDIAPIIAVDMNCNLYATRTALAEFANILNLDAEEKKWIKEAENLKKKLFEVCFDEDDKFFYDVDKFGVKRKYLSSTVFHLFLEKVLDLKKDKDLINDIIRLHIKNEKEFWTNYPFPSMAICDKSCENHTLQNCWGYYSQALIALRCIRWMEYYGLKEEFKIILEKWVRGWTFENNIMFGQELDPITGKSTDCSRWYSSCMLLYLYAVKYLNI